MQGSDVGQEGSEQGRDSEQDEEAFEDAAEDGATRASDGSSVGVVRSLSQRTLALVVPAVQELVVTLVGIWAQMLLVLIATRPPMGAATDAVVNAAVEEEADDAEAEVFHSADSQLTRLQPQFCP